MFFSDLITLIIGTYVCVCVQEAKEREIMQMSKQ